MGTDDPRPSVADELARCDQEEARAKSALTVAIVLLVIALAAWFGGSALWMAKSAGAARWLGGILEVVGFLGTLGAIGMIWRAVRWQRAVRSVRKYLQSGTPVRNPDAAQYFRPQP